MDSSDNRAPYRKLAVTGSASGAGFEVITDWLAECVLESSAERTKLRSQSALSLAALVVLFKGRAPAASRPLHTLVVMSYAYATLL